MDELLAERVKQLQAIDERLERIQHHATVTRHQQIEDGLQALRNDLTDMIREAERQHAEF